MHSLLRRAESILGTHPSLLPSVEAESLATTRQDHYLCSHAAVIELFPDSDVHTWHEIHIYRAGRDGDY